MNDQPLSNRAGAGLVKVVIITLVIQLLVIGYVFFQGYRDRQAIVDAARLACRDRGKTANQANADFQTAHTRYLHGLIQANLLHGETKDLADEAIVTYRRTSALLHDLATVNCEKVHPNARLIP